MCYSKALLHQSPLHTSKIYFKSSPEEATLVPCEWQLHARSKFAGDSYQINVLLNETSTITLNVQEVNDDKFSGLEDDSPQVQN